MFNLENTSRILTEALDWATEALGRLFRHRPYQAAKVYSGRHRFEDPNPLRVVAQW